MTRLFKQVLVGWAEVAAKAGVTLTNYAIVHLQGALKSYSGTVPSLLNHYDMDDNITKLDVEVCNRRQGLLSPVDYTQGMWTRTVRCRSTHDGKSLKALFAEGVTFPIRQTLQNWWTEHQHGFLEHFPQRS